MTCEATNGVAILLIGKEFGLGDGKLVRADHIKRVYYGLEHKGKEDKIKIVTLVDADELVDK